MKKIKLITPIFATIGVITPILTACNKTSTVNQVVLQRNQKLERTVSANSSTVAFYFLQQNPSSPKDTKVYLNDFAINDEHGLEAPTGTLKYVADSDGNMRVIVNVKTILTKFKDTKTIQFKLLFKNETVNTQWLIGPATITISSGKAEDKPVIYIPQEVEALPFSTSFDNASALCSFSISSDPQYSSYYLPTNITLLGDGEELVEGEDYIYFITNNGKQGNVWFANSFSKVTLSLKTVTEEVTVRNTIPFGYSGATWTNNVLTIDTIGNNFTWNVPSTVTATTTSFRTCLIKRKNNTELIDPIIESKDDKSKALSYFKSTIQDLYNDESIDQSISYLLVKYYVEGTDSATTETVHYYGSCVIKVNKNKDKPITQ